MFQDNAAKARAAKAAKVPGHKRRGRPPGVTSLASRRAVARRVLEQEADELEQRAQAIRNVLESY